MKGDEEEREAAAQYKVEKKAIISYMNTAVKPSTEVVISQVAAITSSAMNYSTICKYFAF